MKLTLIIFLSPDGVYQAPSEPDGDNSGGSDRDGRQVPSARRSEPAGTAARGDFSIHELAQRNLDTFDRTILDVAAEARRSRTPH